MNRLQPGAGKYLSRIIIGVRGNIRIILHHVRQIGLQVRA